MVIAVAETDGERRRFVAMMMIYLLIVDILFRRYGVSAMLVVYDYPDGLYHLACIMDHGVLSVLFVSIFC